MGRPLYVDSSVLLTIALTQAGWETVAEALDQAQGNGYSLISSRLLWLEAARVATRERLIGNNVDAVLNENLNFVDQLPITDEVWNRAVSIDQHIKTPDAIHLATCELVEATLVTVGLDGTLRKVAGARGIPLLTA
jgi:predicted nucleic acid-binding protein